MRPLLSTLLLCSRTMELQEKGVHTFVHHSDTKL